MPVNSPARLIIFTRYPEPGKAKTRLIPVLGPEKAADLQRRMTESTIQTARALVSKTGIELEIRYDGGDHGLMSDWLGPDITLCRQGDGDLGEKMDRAFSETFADGIDRVMIIGSDCPGLSPDILATGFSQLASHDLVLGPAGDGGYYLIGLAAPCPPLFRNRPWGSKRLLAETVDTAKIEDLKFFLLEELNDVDRPEDLHDLGDHSYPE